LPRWGQGSLPSVGVPKLPRPLLKLYLRASRRLSRFENNLCGSFAKLIFRLKLDGSSDHLEGEVKAIPLGCGSVFCPVCNGKKKRDFFRKRRISGWGVMVTVTAHYWVNSALETRQVLEEFYEYIRKFYRFRIGDPKKIRRMFFEELRRSNLSPQQKHRQLEIFRRFYPILRVLAKYYKQQKKDFRLYHILWGVGVVEVTVGRDERGYYVHPHLHMFAYGGPNDGIVPQVLLVAIWREVTGGKFYIAHAKAIPSRKAKEYFEGYVEVGVEGDFPRRWLEFGLYRHKRFLDWRPQKVRQDEAFDRLVNSLENASLGYLSRWFSVKGIFPRFIDDYLIEEIGLLVPARGILRVTGQVVEWFLDNLVGIWRPPPDDWKLVKLGL